MTVLMFLIRFNDSGLLFGPPVYGNMILVPAISAASHITDQSGYLQISAAATHDIRTSIN